MFASMAEREQARKFFAKVVEMTERPSPLLEMFSTNLEKLLFMRYFAKFCSRCSAKLHSAISLTTRQTSSELGLLSLLCEIPTVSLNSWRQRDGQKWCGW